MVDQATMDDNDQDNATPLSAGFGRAGLIGSGVWILLCLFYISYWVGWGNLFSMLPSEMGFIFLVAVLPLGAVLGLNVLMNIGSQVSMVGNLMSKQSDMVETIGEGVQKVAEETRQSREILVADLTAHKSLAQDMAAALENQSSGLTALTTTLQNMPAPVAAAQGGAVDEERDEMSDLAMLVNLFNVALSDLSVTCTSLVRVLREDAGYSKREVREFIGEMVNAYATGDKNVFFRAMKAQLEAHPETLDQMKTLSKSNTQVRQAISKLLREAEQIMQLVQRFDRQHLFRIVVEDGDLWGLRQILIEHFTVEGNVRG
ncbi:hypothetical protein [Magnetospira sp. QH-2]|uniref:hypothetical protein n=1 Tax=Magnetospira sp. (strain QH-2) TaxID=1288970 RepID=UPI0003E81C11|nr:hypothetical protein [Magnetospira sp. QH-2]CCQ73006.1 magnetosome protein MamY [Magnetospira sp. QH-2]